MFKYIYSVLVSIIKLTLKCISTRRFTTLLILILSLDILVIEISVEVVLVIHPALDHMWIRLMKMSRGWLSVDENILAIVANVITQESLISPENHLTPKVGVLSALMHSCVGLEMLLDEVLILREHCLNLFVSCPWIFKDLVEIASYSILLIVKSIEVDPLDGVNMSRLKLSQHTLVKSNDPLLLGKFARILNGISKEIVYFLETKVLAVVIRF